MTPEASRTRGPVAIERRALLKTVAVAAAAIGAGGGRRKRILLRSSWQTVNIGDIAHTPGLLAILERHLPDVDVTLWPSDLDNGVEALLRRRFPQLRIATDRAAVESSFDDCDLLLHGSGPSLVAERDVPRWHEETGKPFGVYGITFSRTAPTGGAASPVSETIDLLNAARFVFFRDSASLALARECGCTGPVTGLGPDGAFGTDLRNDSAAEAFLAAHGLEAGRFLCCIPRLRYTPYWSIASKNARFDPVKHARNEALKEHDHAPLRQAITDVVRETDMSVLVCPEDVTQVAVGRERIVERLPEDVRGRVVWRDRYWLPDEALSTYARSAGLFGNEMHSPIMCIGNGVPAIVCRWAEQTSKGLMWRDIGLGEWLFDFDQQADLQRLPPAVLAIARDPDRARQRAEQAKREVERLTAVAMTAVADSF